MFLAIKKKERVISGQPVRINGKELNVNKGVIQAARFYFPWERRSRGNETQVEANNRRDVNRLTTSGFGGAALGVGGVLGGVVTGGVLPILLGLGSTAAGAYVARRGVLKNRAENERLARQQLEQLQNLERLADIAILEEQLRD